ncbi:M15 family metallopeptidase [Moraxella atlantae]|uniref:D-alanyl-D-alanine carboxypeptidase n=1 Tax=Faucicola atlantae TaxID=34059 RepID=A0A378Q6B6_9GAMM|nr:M15 family metallopeptidase [Moraxella atlantae]OPH33792.1 hypothetical protein B5J92_09125 [Moraxella atlantae]STY94727.1 D-alanyl-D-alanine carboxypeptidase [Moraxella atlantae]
MSLGTKQWLAVGAIIAGLVTLPMVGAQLWENGQTSAGYIASSDGKTTYLPKATTNQNYSLHQQDMPRNEWQANDSMNGLIAQHNSPNASRNQNYHQPYSQSGSGIADCQYSKDAIKAGVKHYRFDEARAADLESIGGRHQLTHEAAAALRQLQAAARKDGVNLPVGSAFRSVAYQQGIVNRKRAAGQSDAQIFKVSSAPGYSEHHTGYALDFEPINHSFGNTKAYAWLRQNAARYGWEQSFTPEAVRNTRVAVEEWHWKYKGSPTAKAALANDVCYFRP